MYFCSDLGFLFGSHYFSKWSASGRWKISAIIEWPKPITVRGLRGFLGLTGYYWKFVLNCGTIAAPLMAILEKNSFHWTDDVITVFERLKSTMTTTPILILPKFELIFVIEWNASDIGIRAALLQQNNPVAYFNRTWQYDIKAFQHMKKSWLAWLRLSNTGIPIFGVTNSLCEQTITFWSFCWNNVYSHHLSNIELVNLCLFLFYDWIQSW